MSEDQARYELPTSPDMPDSPPVCERCGHVHTGNYPELTEDVKREYMRRILSGVPFSHTYRLYNQEFTLTFRTITAREAVPLNEALREIKRRDVSGDNMRDSLCLKVLFHLAEKQEEVYNIPTVMSGVQAYLDEYDRRFGNLAELLEATIVETFLMFQDLTRVLERSGFDKDFYKGAGLTWSPAPSSTDN